MSLAQAAGFKPAYFYPYLNTRSPIDICTGIYVKGFNGAWLLDAGAAPVNGFSARSGYFKSTTVDNMVVNLMEIYPRSEYFKYDTENTSTSLQRFYRLAQGLNVNVDERVHLTNKGEMNLKEYVEFLTNLGEYKLKNKQEYLVETPFLDTNTGKPLKIMVPTFISLDSISNLSTDNIDFSTGMEDKSNNTADMYDARIKKRLMDLFITYAYRYSMYFFVTAHVDSKIEIDPRRPTPKQNQWLKQGEKITNAGKNFQFLPNLSFQLARPKPLVDQDGQPLYPSGDLMAVDREKVEINKLEMKVLRGKNNMTGTIIPTVMSQHRGVLADLSYYEYLRDVSDKAKSGEYESSGFLLKGYNRFSPLLPDVPFHRNSIRQTCDENYAAKRTLELMFQFHWIHHYWNTSAYPYDIPATIESLVERINQSSRIDVNDVLQSRGYWTYDTEEKRPYMSIMDVFELVGMKDVNVSVQVADNITPAPATSPSDWKVIPLKSAGKKKQK